MILNIGQDEYVPAVGDTAGMRMVVHPQYRMPFPEDEGIMISPGMSTQVGIKEVRDGKFKRYLCENKPYYY